MKPTLRDYLSAQCHTPEMQAKLELLFGLRGRWSDHCDGSDWHESECCVKELLDELESIIGDPKP